MVNNWIGYVKRGYDGIKSSLLNKLSINVPEITDRSESNIMVILISMWAGLIEQINYYIDMMTRENYISTARLYDSFIKLGKLYDYRVRFSIPSRADVVISITDNSTGDPVDATSDILIPEGTIIKGSSDSSIFITDEDYTIPTGDSFVWGKCTQHSKVTNSNIGNTAGIPNEILSINNQIADGSISITINGNAYQYVETLGFSSGTDKHFTTSVDKNKDIYLLFGDGINGAIVEVGNVIGNYYLTHGEKGNSLKGELSEINLSPSNLPIGTLLSVTNPDRSQSGVGVEDTLLLRKKIPLSIRTLNRAVTLNDRYNDFADVAILSAGIYEADAVKSDCGFLVDIYVVPWGGGLATSAQLTITNDYVTERSVIGSVIRVHPAGESKLVIHADVTGKPNYLTNKIHDELVFILTLAYNWKTKKLGDEVHLSDIIALMDNSPVVDYLTITNFYATPFPNPLDTTDVNLLWDVEVIDGDPSIEFILELQGTSTNTYQLFGNGVYLLDILVGTPTSLSYLGVSVIIDISSTFSLGHPLYRWKFIVQPRMQDINLTDHSLPVFLEENIHLNIIEQ